jgi:hypothetical protein
MLQLNAYGQCITLKYQDALTILGYIGALLGTQHPELTVNKVNTTTDTRSTLTGFHELLYPECHHLTRKHLILGLNHLNGRTPINPRLMYPLQYMDPEYHHTTYKHLTVGLNHSKE